MKLASIDDRDRAAALRGSLVCVRRGAFPPLGEGEFYVCDVEGARVVLAGEDDTGDRAEVGRVVELREYPTVQVLVVDAADGGRRWEVPLVEEIVREMDLAGGTIVLRTLEGVERE